MAETRYVEYGSKSHLLWQLCHLTFPSNSEMARDVRIGIKWQRGGMSEMAENAAYYGNYVISKWHRSASIMAGMSQ